MAARALAGLLLLARAAAAPAGLSEAQSEQLEDVTLAELTVGCPLVLRQISESTCSDMQVALECRARFTPDLCRGRFAELGPRPWADEKIQAACGGMAGHIRESLDRLPRELQDAGYKRLQDQLNKCTEAKVWVSQNPPLNFTTKKPIKIKTPYGTFDAAFIFKIGMDMEMQDMTKKYHAKCPKGKTCPTPKPPPAFVMPALKGIAVSLSKGENPILKLPPPVQKGIAFMKWKNKMSHKVPPKKPSKKPSASKLFTDAGGPILEGASRASAGLLAAAAAGTALLAVGALALRRRPSSPRRQLLASDAGTEADADDAEGPH